jgi:hypothetical protein
MRTDLAGGAVLWWKLEFFGDNVGESVLHGGPGKGCVAKYHLVQKHPKRPKVHSGRRPAALYNLRRHILWCANEAPALQGGAEGRWRDGRGQVEVGEANVPTAAGERRAAKVRG